MKVGAVIVAAGRGLRAGGGLPKQWRKLAGATVAEHTVRAFADHDRVGPITVVMNTEDIDAPAVPNLTGVTIVSGGTTRSASVLAGLLSLKDKVDKVLIHDAARPCVSENIITDVITALETESAAAPAIPVVDALWTGADGRVTGTADRTGLYRAQTPQGFDINAILEAHRSFPDGAADDVELARRNGMEVIITEGSDDNLKITTPADFSRAERILRTKDGH